MVSSVMLAGQSHGSANLSLIGLTITQSNTIVKLGKEYILQNSNTHIIDSVQQKSLNYVPQKNTRT